jgi:CRP-like cAMP-binding protein
MRDVDHRGAEKLSIQETRMLIDDLRTNLLTGSLSDAQVSELAAVGEEIVFVPGQELFREGDQAENLWILLEGRVEVVRRSADEPTVLFTMTKPGQWAGGWQAWETGTPQSGTTAHVRLPVSR